MGNAPATSRRHAYRAAEGQPARSLWRSITQRGGAILLALGGCSVLPGCIAAALPIVASGVIARSEIKGDDAEGQAGMLPTTAVPATPSAASPAGRPGAAPGVTVLEGVTELPAPDGAVPSRGGSPDFARYIETQLAAGATRSALLGRPTRLEPVRFPCAERAAMLLLDLDPRGRNAGAGGRHVRRSRAGVRARRPAAAEGGDRLDHRFGAR